MSLNLGSPSPQVAQNVQKSCSKNLQRSPKDSKEIAQLPYSRFKSASLCMHLELINMPL